MGGTLLLLLVLTGGGPLADVLRAEAKGIGFQPAFSLASPAFVFSEARSWTPAAFWPALGVNSAIVAGLLGLSSLLLPRTWQEKRSSVTGKGALASRWWRFGGRRRSTRLRLKLLDANPALWLACREHWQAAVLWLVAIVALAAAVALLLVRAEPEWWMVWGYLGGLLTLFLCLAVTSRATRFFVEARKSGLLELLLATPLTAQRIVHGQWLGFLRLFALPLALYFAVSLGASVMMHQVTWRHMSAATVTTTTVTAGTTNAAPAVVVATGSGGSNIAAPTNSAGAMPPVSAATTVAPPGVWLAILMAAVTTLTALGNLAALSWFGMWMGLTSRTTNTATLLTLLYVQIIPWFVASFVVALSVPLLLLPTIFKGTSPTPGFFLIWFPLLTVGGQSIIYLGKDLFFILFARRRLLTRFRDSVAFAASPRPIRVTPPALVAAPPVIADYKFGEPQDLASIQDKVDPSPR
jgi:hypothetical protein